MHRKRALIINKKTKLLFYLLIISFGFANVADILVTHLEKSDIEAKVDSLFIDWDKQNSPGAAIAIVRGTKILYTKGYGTANIEFDNPITSETVFYIGSIAKQFTAFAVALLEAQGKLSFDDDIRVYLPELHDFGQSITIRHLIHHTSGLRDYFGLLALASQRESDFITQNHIFHIIEKQRELNFSPGKEFLYSNSNYILLATIVEHVTGQSFSQWVKEHIFDPLGMKQTLVGDDHKIIIKQQALSYRASEGVDYKIEVMPYSGYGAGGIYSTVKDLARWVSNYMVPVVGNVDLIAQIQERGILNNGDTISYAFGLLIDEYRGLKRIGHRGELAGYRTYVVLFPDQNFSIVILGNSASFNPKELAVQVADLYLFKNFTKPKSELPVKDINKLEVVEINQQRADDCTGDFEVEPRTGLLASFWYENNSYYTHLTGFPTVKLFPSSDSTFFNKNVDLYITFHEDKSGKISSYTSQLRGFRASGIRIQLYKPTFEELGTYIGRYYSPELETVYTLTLEDGKLIVGHQRHIDFEIKPIEQDRFVSSVWFFREIMFKRDSRGYVIALYVSNGRNRNVLFEKQ